MTNVDELKQEEIDELNGVNVEAEEVGLEDLIVLGEDKKIPIHIIYPKADGTKAKAQALVKQLTLKELDLLNLNTRNAAATNLIILRKALFKTNGEAFTDEELKFLPLGVVNEVAEKILELSGVDVPAQNKIKDF